VIRELSSSIFLFVPGNETVRGHDAGDVAGGEILKCRRSRACPWVGIAVIVVMLVRRLSGSAYLTGE